MSKERKIVGIWPAGDAQPVDGAVPSVAPDAAANAAQETSDADTLMLENPDIAGPDSDPIWLGFADEENPATGGFPWVAVLIAATSLIWAGLVGWIATAGFAAAVPLAQIPSIIVSIVAPIAVLLLIWLLAERGSERSVTRHLRLLDRMRTEQRHLAERLIAMDRYWHDAHATLATHAANYTSQALDAGRQIDETSLTLQSRMREALGHAAQINEQGEAARRHMESLIVALPKVDDVARRAADTMREAGQTAYQFGGQLEARIAAIGSEAGESQRVIETADAALAARIEALITATSGAERSALATGERFGQLLAGHRDGALGLLADLAGGIDGSISTVEQRIEAARTTLESSSTAQLAQLARGVSDAENRAGALTAVLNGAVDRSTALDSELSALVEAVSARVETMEQQVSGRLTSLQQAVSDMQALFDRLGEDADASTLRAAGLGEQAASVLTSLRDATQEVDVALPAAVARLRQHVASSTEELTALPPLVEANEAGMQRALDRLRESEAVLEQQVATLAAIDQTATASLAIQASAFGDLRAAIEALAQRMAKVNDETAPAMLVTMAQAEQTASAAAERARVAISKVVQSSSSELEEVFGNAIEDVANDVVAERLAHISDAADQAVAAATAASDRLMRQLITIADSSAALETRAAAVAASVERSDRDTLARQMAMLSESLQSTAVDLTRILSADVADQAWAAYLKGDRGIFSRRAVRLLSAGEARDVLSRYQDDEDFRGLVNRYIHDFEAMLGALLDTRDGSALSVTMLSSDIGKLYVALAQAIERLRH